MRTKKSKTFQGSRKYERGCRKSPRAIILTTASFVKQSWKMISKRRMAWEEEEKALVGRQKVRVRAFRRTRRRMPASQATESKRRTAGRRRGCVMGMWNSMKAG
jgi:hypothetical protein